VLIENKNRLISFSQHFPAHYGAANKPPTTYVPFENAAVTNETRPCYNAIGEKALFRKGHQTTSVLLTTNITISANTTPALPPGESGRLE